jgi:hypothetical protein
VSTAPARSLGESGILGSNTRRTSGITLDDGPFAGVVEHERGSRGLRRGLVVSAVARFTRGLDWRARSFVARARRRVFPLRVRHVAGPTTANSSDTSLVVVCLVRDGAAHLDGFVEHYRRLGAAHIVLLDNGSRDGTLERAATLEGVSVLGTMAPYRAYRRVAKRYLVERYGKSGWVLCVDIDELFDYPYRDRVPLPAFLGYLRARSYSAVVSHLLDLFPRGPLLEVDVERPEHRYYDISHVEHEPYVNDRSDEDGVSTPDERLRAYLGGIRRKAFGVRANLTKRPLLYPPAGPTWVTSHYLSGAKEADVTGVLLHYKYLGPFHDHALRAVRERSYHRDSEEYREYVKAFERDPRIDLSSPASRELVHVDQLVDEGFLVVSPEYRRLAGTA